jgi:TP901 family phage tail tape measure protein
MGMLPPVVATLLADNKQFNAKMDESTAKMEKFGASSEAAGARVSKAMSAASTGVLGAAAVIGVASLKLASDFQTLTTQLVTGAGESVKNLEMIRNGLLNLAGQVGQTPADLAKGMYLIESAGFHGAAGLKVLRAAAEGAVIGAAPMATVADAVTTALHDYNLSATHSNAVTSALVETVASGKTTMTDLATSIGKVLPVAQAYGLSMQQVLGAMAVMTSSGLSARFAATNLKTAIASLEAPSTKSLKEFTALGLSADKFHKILVDPKQGLGPAIAYIESGLAKLPRNSLAYAEAMKTIFGNITAGTTALMLGGQHAQEFATNVDNIGNALQKNTSNVQGWALAQKDLSTQLGKLKGSAYSLAIRLGDWILPKATAVTQWLDRLVKKMQTDPAFRSGVASAFTGALAIAGGVKLAGFGASLAAAFGASAESTAVAGPIGAAIALAILEFVKIGGVKNFSDLITGHGVGRKKAGENILGNFWNANMHLGEGLIQMISGKGFGALLHSNNIPDWLAYHETTPTTQSYRNKFGGGDILPTTHKATTRTGVKVTVKH